MVACDCLHLDAACFWFLALGVIADVIYAAGGFNGAIGLSSVPWPGGSTSITYVLYKSFCGCLKWNMFLLTLIYFNFIVHSH